jgi:hypothetical protein
VPKWFCDFLDAQYKGYHDELRRTGLESGAIEGGEGRAYTFGRFLAKFSFAAATARIGPLRAASAVEGGVGATSAASVNRIFSARVLERMAEESGPFHNFPQAVGEQVFAAGQRTVVSPNYVQYTMRGVVNGVEGTYEIGVRPSASGRTEVITHWFFRPDKQ